MKAKAFFKKHMFMIVVTLLLTAAMVYAAYEIRQYFAVGGEWAPLVFMGLYLLCDWYEEREKA